MPKPFEILLWFLILVVIETCAFEAVILLDAYGKCKERRVCRAHWLLAIEKDAFSGRRTIWRGALIAQAIHYPLAVACLVLCCIELFVPSHGLAPTQAAIGFCGGYGILACGTLLVAMILTLRLDTIGKGLIASMCEYLAAEHRFAYRSLSQQGNRVSVFVREGLTLTVWCGTGYDFFVNGLLWKKARGAGARKTLDAFFSRDDLVFFATHKHVGARPEKRFRDKAGYRHVLTRERTIR